MKPSSASPSSASVIQIWEDRNTERPGYFRAYWTKDAGDTVGSPVVGYASPGGSHKTLKACVAEVRKLGHTDPIYRNGRILDSDGKIVLTPAYTIGRWSINEWPQGDSEIRIGANGTPRICTVHMRHTSINEQKANAHLIAAAPELLEALQQAVARIILANEEGNPILSAWLPEARAAIAKAEGKS